MSSAPTGSETQVSPGVRASAAAGGAGHPAPRSAGAPPRIALLGNPNTGKTTLFNRLCGLRHKTSNFPGTTLEARLGRLRLDGRSVAGGARSDCCGQESVAIDAGETGNTADLDLIDMPGIYSLELDHGDADVCRAVLAGEAAPRGDRAAPPEAVCVVLDATNLGRNLVMAGEVLRRRLPTVMAVNMIDLARRQGLSIDGPKLGQLLGCRVVLVSARTGEGLDELRTALANPQIPTHTGPGGVGEGGSAALRRWADDIYAQVGELSDPSAARDTLTDRLDRVFTHPVGGVLAFAAIMAGLFYSLFFLAKYPMDWIEWIFSRLGSVVTAIVPEGILQDLLTNGVVAGISGTVVFLPQICLLFFLISLLEDTGYLARAAFVMDRALRPFGLPGHSFVPLLSSHACALPGIMAARAIPDRRERLATILVAPFMTCSARLPVYVLVTTILFGDRPALAAVAFVGCYALGIAAGVLSALLARRTILKGESRPMCLELPTYKLPSLRTALVTTWDRGFVFLKKAGTNIMMICIVLWWLGSYPHVSSPQSAVQMRAEAAAVVGVPPQDLDASLAEAEAAGREVDPRALDLISESDRLTNAHAKAHSFMGRAGRAAEPLFRPLGYDWQLTIGVLTSFAAREVFVSTMAVVLAGDEDADVTEAGVLQQIKSATRDDGTTPVFSTPTCWSLLVFFVLAMQCLPTLAVTARESGHVKWALLQLAWMSIVAYGAAALAYHLAGG